MNKRSLLISSEGTFKGFAIHFFILAKDASIIYFIPFSSFLCTI
ncbi:hypothetical protein bmyco0002_53910 [Bacillus pseudomycoides]|nr:hypothetical protein bmyco0002_53910 [Bacillus pseudomycoides]